ncbi:MAG: hypothetical protein RLZZ385_2203 [Pseudomonadota bacterium]|jgi:DNA polymerase-3 subunit chi
MVEPAPSVNFYPLTATEPDAHLVFACRLAEKALGLGHRVHVHLDDPEQAQRLDQLLWQFRPSAFIPHERLDSADPEALATVRVTLGHGELLPPQPDVLINLAAQVCAQHRKFRRISDIVPAVQPGLDLGRQRYRFYQEQGYGLDTFRV